MTSVATREPARFARAIRAACDSYGDAPPCDYPACNEGQRICWLHQDYAAYEAFAETWEAPQRLGDERSA